LGGKSKPRKEREIGKKKVSEQMENKKNQRKIYQEKRGIR